jgi:oligoendopeptidase F
VVVSLLAFAPGRRAAAQGAFNPFAGVDSLRYRFDLARNFYPSETDAERDRARLSVRIAAWVEASKSASFRAERPAVRAAAFADLISGADSILVAAGKQLAYLTLRANLDVGDQRAMRDLATFQAELTTMSTPLNAILTNVPLGDFQSSPRLAKWAFLAQRARAAAGPATTPLVDSAIAALTQWEAPTFNAVLRETNYGLLDTPEGKRDVRDWSAFANHRDRSVREAGFRAAKRGLEEHEATHALLLTSTIRAQEAAARLSGAVGFREQSYGQRYLSRRVVRDILDSLAATAELNKRYETARNKHIAQVERIDTVHTWDLTVAEPGMSIPRFTIGEAASIFRAALAPLGPEYAREIDGLMDPANGRLDLIPRPGRAQRPGFSTGNVGYPSVFFQGRYAGFIDDVVVLVHEGGHSVQNMLMTSHGVPYMYSGGPSYFTESFAGFNELLVTDYLYRTAPDRAHRIYYLQRFLDQATEIYKSAREALLEDSLYDAVLAGRVSSAAEVELLTQEIGSRYSIWFRPGGERVMEWVNASMAVTRPLYRVNYVFSKLLALGYFAEYARDSAAFVPRYNALLAGGYPARPDVLLQPLGLEVSAAALVPRAVGVIRKRLAELLELYGG